MKVYKTMRTFLGMDEGQTLWQAWDSKGYCIAWAVADGEGADEVTAAITASIGTTPYSVNKRNDARKFAVMLKHDETIARMIDDAARTLAKWWDEDWFELDDDWEAGYKMGRRSTMMPRVPRNRNRHHYEHGAALGLESHVAKMTDTDYDFINTWVVPYKAKESPYGE